MRAAHRLASWLAVLAFVAAALRAEVRPHGLFTEGAVLQQGVPVPVWGRADDGEEIAVTCAGQTVTTAASNGEWRVTLRPLTAGGPVKFVIRGHNTITLTNVLVGEVWIASGQSNMWWPLWRTTNGTEVAAQAADTGLRLFTVAPAESDTPYRNVEGSWQACGPESVSNFSAIAYYFGRHLRAARGVPVGLINSSNPGTRAEAWTPPSALDLDAKVKAMIEANIADEDQRSIYQASRERLSHLYNAMIAPLQPFPIRGVIWYQGESNMNRAGQYARLLSAMIRGWRHDWGVGEFPFLFVQLAPWREMSPWLREAQLEA
ncbi:MAG: sialate O-acetylesterase, partial [Kiritimatiellae bacterium]|nr:sialate O-acetylesterase [Kiritimatiellia bacterium]